MFIEFFKQAITDKNADIKNKAVFNLPCFYLTYKNSNEEIKKYFNQVYLDLSKDGSVEI